MFSDGTLLTPGSVNTLHIRERAGKGSRLRPTLMPFEMPQLSSAAVMNDHRQQRTHSARQMLRCPNREQYVNRVQWPATWNCWIIQVSECDTLSIQLESLHDVNKFMVPACLYADSINLSISVSSLLYCMVILLRKVLSLKLELLIKNFLTESVLYYCCSHASHLQCKWIFMLIWLIQMHFPL